ncbi:hypothetical protein A1O3_00736 [Capronia epimyces CBS 606.96]|uniref:Tyrosyl-DNA phosphodiesterase 1 n=1 Tax=Capronia epimyces CBS 606.96 TaxID=1182542 RepID=W9YSE5_9EURO|nr:uncharacterized protein A1O3_00736 [Capronia epimyces CBS 606.96]EXJ92186.1 hypothetical protein A1O3_00736 [Capronia epimyces CBS 606.96]
MTSPPSKRLKLDADADHNHDHDGASPIALNERAVTTDTDRASIRTKRAAFLDSISRSISPPAVSRSGTTTPQADHRNKGSSSSRRWQETRSLGDVPDRRTPHGRGHDQDQRPTRGKVSATVETTSPTSNVSTALSWRPLPSPFKLTSIRDLPASQNIDTVSLHDILGNPLIKEAWIFNYCFDVDWLMGYFDADIRAQVKVKVVHGSWRAEDANRIGIEDACRRWPNVEPMTAYLPDPFGTHHSKMFILFTHDDLAQVVIHTANMLQKDWTNMTQAVWQSPMLPKMEVLGNPSTTVGRIGTGSRFKLDLMAYLSAYGSKTKHLRDELVQYDFSRVRGALIASVPSRMKNLSIQMDAQALWDQKLWGYPSLFRALETVCPGQCQSKTKTATADQSNFDKSHPHPHVVCQVSSIATLPMPWLNQFFPAICGQKSRPTAPAQIYTNLSIVYPTPSNVAASLDGYASGGSIHTKAQSAAHLKQITSLRSALCQWTRGPREESRARRDLAAPHIKTYVRFRSKPTIDDPVPDIDWALMTSANLSTQAWGALRETEKGKGKGKGKEKAKEVVVQSFEIGVLVWPELFGDDVASPNTTKLDDDDYCTTSIRTVRMVPVFGQDTPSPSLSPSPAAHDPSVDTSTVVGLRLPYDLPLTPYAEVNMPWSPQGTYDAPDRHGRRWPRDFF